MSLMYTRNSKGPNKDPCGTPEVTLAHADGHPLHTTCCCRSVRKALIHLCNTPLTPMWSSFRSSLWCRTESKASAKSKKMICELAPLLRVLANWWIVSKSCVWQEWVWRKPCWNVLSLSLSLKNLISLLCIRRSNTWQQGWWGSLDGSSLGHACYLS